MAAFIKFKCDFCFCDAEFRNPNDLELHTHMVHEWIPLQCHLCHKKFISENYLRAHMRTIHAPAPIVETETESMEEHPSVLEDMRKDNAYADKFATSKQADKFVTSTQGWWNVLRVTKCPKNDTRLHACPAYAGRCTARRCIKIPTVLRSEVQQGCMGTRIIKAATVRDKKVVAPVPEKKKAPAIVPPDKKAATVRRNNAATIPAKNGATVRRNEAAIVPDKKAVIAPATEESGIHKKIPIPVIYSTNQSDKSESIPPTRKECVPATRKNTSRWPRPWRNDPYMKLRWSADHLWQQYRELEEINKELNEQMIERTKETKELSRQLSSMSTTDRDDSFSVLKLKEPEKLPLINKRSHTKTKTPTSAQCWLEEFRESSPIHTYIQAQILNDTEDRFGGVIKPTDDFKSKIHDLKQINACLELKCKEFQHANQETTEELNKQQLEIEALQKRLDHKSVVRKRLKDDAETMVEEEQPTSHFPYNPDVKQEEELETATEMWRSDVISVPEAFQIKCEVDVIKEEEEAGAERKLSLSFASET